MTITGDQSLLKNINRMALIRLVRGRPGLSRADLAELTGLTKSTISQLVQELVDEGWLCEDDALVTGSIGRRPTPLRLDDARLALVGVDLNSDGIEIVTTTLCGAVIQRDFRTLAALDLEPVIAETASLIADVVRDARLAGRRVLGVGVGVPGPVHQQTGVLHYSPNLGWRNVKLRDTIQKALVAHELAELPLFVLRRSGVAVLGEIEFSDAPAEQSLLYVHASSKIGAGVFVGGRLLSGHGGFAGEVGSHQISYGGKSGTGNAMIGTLAQAGRMGLTEAQFFERVAAGDAEAIAINEEAGQFLAVLLLNLWMTFDPSRIVLGAIRAEVAPHFVASAMRTLEHLAEGGVVKPPALEMVRFGDQAVVIGAAALVLHNQLALG